MQLMFDVSPQHSVVEFFSFIFMQLLGSHGIGLLDLVVFQAPSGHSLMVVIFAAEDREGQGLVEEEGL